MGSQRVGRDGAILTFHIHYAFSIFSLLYYFLSLLLSLFIPFTVIYVFQNVQNKIYYKIREVILGNLHHSPLQEGCVRNEGMNIYVMCQE